MNNISITDIKTCPGNWGNEIKFYIESPIKLEFFWNSDNESDKRISMSAETSGIFGWTDSEIKTVFSKKEFYSKNEVKQNILYYVNDYFWKEFLKTKNKK